MSRDLTAERESVPEKSQPTARRQRTRRLLCAVLLGVSLLLIAVLAIPLCCFLLSIEGIWSLTDRMLRKLEG